MRGSIGQDYRNSDTEAYRASSDANQRRIKRDERVRTLKGMLDLARRMENPFHAAHIGCLIAAVEKGDYDA